MKKDKSGATIKNPSHMYAETEMHVFGQTSKGQNKDLLKMQGGADKQDEMTILLEDRCIQKDHICGCNCS